MPQVSKLEPIAPADVEYRKLPTGEAVAWDRRNNRQFAGPFDDEDEFDEFKKSYFAKK